MISFDFNSELLTYIKDGKVLTRKVEAQEITSILDKTAYFSTGMLPAGTRGYYSKGDRHGLALEFPPHKRKITTTSGVVENVPMPGGVFFARLQYLVSAKSFKMVTYDMFAFEGNSIVDENQPLYRFPTPNIDTGGHICWGSSVKSLSFPKLSGLDDFIRIFLSSTFNDHMTDTPMLNGHFDWKDIDRKYGVHKYFQRLAALGEIKTEWFTPAMQWCNTFKKAMEYFITSQV